MVFSARGKTWAADDLPRKKLRPAGRPDVVWVEHCRRGTTSGGLCGPHFGRRKARRSPGAVSDEIRVRHQPKDRQGTRPYHSAEPARRRRRGDRMRRREFIAGLGSAAGWPLVARAQQGDRVRRIGVLLASVESGNRNVSAFTQALAGLGWIDGRNVRVDLRAGGGDINRIRALAHELVG